MTRNFLHFENSPTPRTYVHSHDSVGPFSFIVGDLDGPWDLTGATLTFFYLVKPDTFNKADITPDPDQVKNKGRASGFWRPGETASIQPGNFPCQVRVTFPALLPPYDTEPAPRIRWAPERPLNTLVLADSLGTPAAVPIETP